MIFLHSKIYRIVSEFTGAEDNSHVCSKACHFSDYIG